MAARTGNLGPWTKEEKEQFLKRGNPGGETMVNPRAGTEVYVEKLPKCNFCDKPALYDAKTRMGPWAYMCEEHFKQHGLGRLGTGFGQRLRPRKALGEAEKLRGEPEKELSITMTGDDLETATFDGVWYPTCPYCGAETPAEPDAHAVYCEACNRRFKIINPFFSRGNLGFTTEAERKSLHERIFGKGSTPPLERLGKGETLNNLLPMSPTDGPPLPRVLALRWPWKK
jgi:hypothetical protein